MSAVGDARKRLMEHLEVVGGEVLIPHADPEEYARIFNEGYDAAMAQHLADDASAADDWLAARDARMWREGWEHHRQHPRPIDPEFGINPYGGAS